MALDEKTCTPDAMPGKMKLDYILASTPSSCPPSSSAIARLSTQSSAFPSPQTHPQIPLSPLSEPSDSVPTTYDATVTSLQESMLVLPDSRHSCRCGKTFPRFLNYLWHLSTNTPGCDIIEGPLYPCHVPSCQSAFRRKTDRTKHVSCVHSKMRPFKCDAPGCSSAFFFSKDVKKHYSTVRTYSIPLTSSLVCALSLSLPSSTMTHSHHQMLPKMRVYACLSSVAQPVPMNVVYLTCRPSPYFSAPVVVVMSNVVTDLKHRPFKCEHCASSFGKKEHLKNHVSRTRTFLFFSEFSSRVYCHGLFCDIERIHRSLDMPLHFRATAFTKSLPTAH